jgi:hypothetical protein
MLPHRVVSSIEEKMKALKEDRGMVLMADIMADAFYGPNAKIRQQSVIMNNHIIIVVIVNTQHLIYTGIYRPFHRVDGLSFIQWHQ